MRCAYRQLPKCIHWVPADIKKGKYSIHISTVTKWIPSAESILTGCMNFIGFEGSYAVLEDDNGKEFKYDSLTFSKVIPYMVNGTVFGPFYLEPYGNRILRYVPVPIPYILKNDSG